MIIFAGLSHGTAPVAVRERCAVPQDQRAQVRAELAARVGPVVLLSTCGRIEVYCAAPPVEAAAIQTRAADWLARRAGLNETDAGLLIVTDTGEAAVERLVRVACGLDSALQGEDEILGQVRRAWLDAGQDGPLPPALDAAFRLAVRTGRQARRTGDPHAWTSLAEGAAARVAGVLRERAAPRVLVSGSGPMGMRAARTLRAEFGKGLDLVLAGRTPERVAVHAGQIHATPALLDELPNLLTWADAAIVALRAPSPLLTAANVPARAGDQPLVIVDLSLPRAVAASAGDVPGVRLLNVDQLTTGGDRRSRWDRAALAEVERLVARAVQDHAALVERPDALTTLVTLRLQADAVRRAQLARTVRRLPHLDGEALAAVDAMTRAIVNRLLHEPTLRLRADADGTTVNGVRELFGLHQGGGADEARPTVVPGW